MRLHTRFYLPILIAAVNLLYAVTLQHNFIWDDNIFLVGNKVYQEFDLAKIFLSLANGVEYLPLRDLTYAVDHFIWGNNPFGFHLTNVLLFLCNILLIFLFTAELPCAGDNTDQRQRSAFLSALLFSVHPLLSESVNFVTCRNVLLSGAFFFMGTLIFVRYLQRDGKSSSRASITILACMLCALLSKATSITLPMILLLLTAYIPSKRTILQRALCIIPAFLLAALFVPFYHGIAEQSRTINPQGDVLLSERFAIAVQIPYFYLGKMLIPLGYSAEYSAEEFSKIFASSEVLMATVGIIVFAAGAYVLRQRAPSIGFSLFWFGITLLPVSNLFATYPVVADRYAYLPMFAGAFLVASALNHFGNRYPKPISGVVVIVVLGLGSITFARNLDWRSDLALWQANIKTEPANAKGYQNLVAEAIIAGDLSLAQQILAEGRTNAPSPMYDYLEGQMHYLRHDLIGALRAFEVAVHQDSEHIRSLLAIGMIYQELGNTVKAEEYYRRTLAAKAVDSWGCRNQAIDLLHTLGRFADIQR